MEILKVSSKSNPSKVAGAIANIYREKGEVEIQTIGAGSLNQAIKAIAICRGFVAPTGDNLVVIPAFNDITINGEQKTAIKLLVIKWASWIPNLGVLTPDLLLFTL